MKRGDGRSAGGRRTKAVDAQVRQMFKDIESAGAPEHLVELADRLEEEATAAPAAKAKAKV